MRNAELRTGATGANNMIAFALMTEKGAARLPLYYAVVLVTMVGRSKLMSYKELHSSRVPYGFVIVIAA